MPDRPDDFFRQFPFGPNLRPVPPRGAGGTGSGVIVKIDGHDAYILTNAHVVNGASNDAITVVLQDGTTISGKSKVTVRGIDTKTDLAVLKVITEKPLSPKHYQAKLGDSDKVRVGQWAVAIGSPFGLASTFTVGVISALGRAQTIQDTTYTNFIQTDVAINPGNSGGALVNIRGEVIGINTAIATGGTRSSAGVGFAIPINKAKRVMEQLIATGRVAHGFIGVLVGDLTEDLQQLAKVKEESSFRVTAAARGEGRHSAGGCHRRVQREAPAHEGRAHRAGEQHPAGHGRGAEDRGARARLR